MWTVARSPEGKDAFVQFEKMYAYPDALRLQSVHTLLASYNQHLYSWYISCLRQINTEHKTLQLSNLFNFLVLSEHGKKHYCWFFWVISQYCEHNRLNSVHFYYIWVATEISEMDISKPEPNRNVTMARCHYCYVRKYIFLYFGYWHITYKVHYILNSRIS